MQKADSITSFQREYDRLRRRLSHLGWISQGSVQDRTDRKGGGVGYQWTRKVAAKTVTVALIQEQFQQNASSHRKLPATAPAVEGNGKGLAQHDLSNRTPYYSAQETLAQSFGHSVSAIHPSGYPSGWRLLANGAA